MQRAIPVAVLALLANVQAEEVPQCLQQYIEYKKKDNCVADLGMLTDPAAQTFPHLIAGGANLNDGACFTKGVDSIKTQCTAEPNKVVVLEESTGDQSCGATSPTTIELQVDGNCNEVTVDGQTLAYKAIPVPPDPMCFDKYEEFDSEATCLAGLPLAEGDAQLTLPFLVGAANEANLKHHACKVDGANSYHTMCSSGAYSPDKLVRYEEHKGDTGCALATSSADYAAVNLEVTATCKSATKPDGSGTFYYKASPARCFNWYAEFPSEQDCNNNKNPLEVSDQVFPFLIGAGNDANAFDKKCSVKDSNSYRTTCGAVADGAAEAGEADATTNIERYGVSNCDVKGKATKSTTALTVDGTCHNFEKAGQTIWYKAVKTTDTTSSRPGEAPPLGDTAACQDNKIVNDAPNEGKRCIEWNAKPVICSSMGYSSKGYDTGLHGKRKRLTKDNAPNSNLCKVTCLDQGDIFCVDKNDLQSNPVCCPAECNDPDNNGQNVCSNALKAVGTHVCSDQFSAARDEFKYLVCPRGNMETECGTKVVKFDVEKDNDKVFTYGAAWYKPGTAENSGDFPLYKFDKQGLCNYVFIMPENAALDSSFEIVFKGSDGTKNRNTQAYYASYISGAEDKLPPIGDILAQYDGAWEYVLPPDADDNTKAQPQGYIQQRTKHDPELRFLELDDLVELDGVDGTAETKVKYTLSKKPRSNTTIAFVSIMTAYSQSDVAGQGSSSAELYKKQYSKFGGAFEFEVRTSFRKRDEAVQTPTDAEVEAYEKAQEEKRSEAVTWVLLALAAVVALVILIFLYQAVCGKHSEQEYQKRAMVYRKEDANIRQTIKRRQSTVIQGEGAGRSTIKSALSKGPASQGYAGVPEADQAEVAADRKSGRYAAPADNEVAEVAADQEQDMEMDKQEDAVEPAGTSLEPPPAQPAEALGGKGPSAVSISDMDMEEGMDGDRNEKTIGRNIGR